MIVYVGIFLNPASIKLLMEKAFRLEREVQNMHCTFSFRPDAETVSAFEKIEGEPAKLVVIGKGYNNENSGFLVELPEEIKALYKNTAVPHITVYVGENGKPVNTGKLNFKPCEQFEVEGVFGLFRTG